MAETGQRLDATQPVGNGLAGWRRIADFIALMKPRPMSVVTFTALAGLLAAPVTPPLSLAAASLAMLCIALGGGGAAVLNMWFERDLDRQMARTLARPLPAGRVAPGEALLFALILIVGSVSAMAVWVNATAAAMLALTIFFYGVVYTMWLKRVTALNVVIGGGLASILTPLTGWVAATSSLSLDAIVLFAFMVPWTPPHVWSQALVRGAEYARAGVPMMPVVAGSRATRWMILGFTILHAGLALLPSALGLAGPWWLATATVGGLVLIALALQLARVADPVDERRLAWRYYRINSLYVVALFLVLILEGASGVARVSPALLGLSG
ncbi:MAG: heme o synthase [Hyphomicrobiaceae bacterium]|nr:heme o synthase [Hyphomicrobiaceae bacterium]